MTREDHHESEFLTMITIQNPAGIKRSTVRSSRLVVASLLLAGLLAGGCRSTTGIAPADTTPCRDPALAALAARATIAIDTAGNTVSREFANRLRGENFPEWLNYFGGKGRKPNHPRQETAVTQITGFLDLIDSAKTWPKPGDYKIRKAAKPPVIDGKLDDEDWKQAATWTGIYPFNKTEASGPATTWRMLWDDHYLYFAFDCADTDVVAPARNRDGDVFFDDCVEMFILPDFRFRTYWEIVIAPNGSLFDSVECKTPQQWGATVDPAQNIIGLKHAEIVRGTLNKSDDADQGYTVEVAVPFNQLPGYTRIGPRAGERLHFMLVRLDRNHGQFTPYAFRPLQAWGHNIWNHAVMELAE
jgi:hypothetical protein